MTEENLARFYHIDTVVMTHTLSEKGQIKQIIPIRTLNSEMEGSP